MQAFKLYSQEFAAIFATHDDSVEAAVLEFAKVASDAETYRLKFQAPEFFGEGRLVAPTGLLLELMLLVERGSDIVESVYGICSSVTNSPGDSSWDTYVAQTAYKYGQVNKTVLSWPMDVRRVWVLCALSDITKKVAAVQAQRYAICQRKLRLRASKETDRLRKEMKKFRKWIEQLHSAAEYADISLANLANALAAELPSAAHAFKAKLDALTTELGFHKDVVQLVQEARPSEADDDDARLAMSKLLSLIDYFKGIAGVDQNVLWEYKLYKTSDRLTASPGENNKAWSKVTLLSALLRFKHALDRGVVQKNEVTIESFHRAAPKVHRGGKSLKVVSRVEAGLKKQYVAQLLSIIDEKDINMELAACKAFVEEHRPEVAMDEVAATTNEVAAATPDDVAAAMPADVTAQVLAPPPQLMPFMFVLHTL